MPATRRKRLLDASLSNSSRFAVRWLARILSDARVTLPRWLAAFDETQTDGYAATGRPHSHMESRPDFATGGGGGGVGCWPSRSEKALPE